MTKNAPAHANIFVNTQTKLRMIFILALFLLCCANAAPTQGWLDQATAEAEAVGGPGAKVVWHLHPPLLRSLGMKRKLKLGAWARPVMSGLARAKAVRGTPLDVFGYAPMRRMERSLVSEYESALSTVVAKLTHENFDEIVAIAELPDGVRGYEDLKLRRATAYREQLAVRTAAIV